MVQRAVDGNVPAQAYLARRTARTWKRTNMGTVWGAKSTRSLHSWTTKKIPAKQDLAGRTNELWRDIIVAQGEDVLGVLTLQTHFPQIGVHVDDSFS